jgi:predicted PurR-regulated permease PerM
MFVLLFFLLASGDLFIRRLMKVMSRMQDKKAVVEVARRTEEQISAYLFTIAVVNTGVGVAVGLSMALLGMPNPVLWGVMAGFFKFIPYLGEICSLTVITIVSFVHFEALNQALWPPVVFLAITGIEANFITPAVLGRKLTLSPVFIFVSIIFWGWLWGVAGAVIAVPLLMAFKILCEQVDPLKPIGEFLSK